MRKHPASSKLFTILLLALFSLCASADEKSAKIDKIFSEWDSTVSPGCSLAVIKDGEIVYKRGYGMANLEHGITNKPDSVYRIASTSKQFTAACIAMLSLRGQLDLDASVREYIPELSETYQPVTVRQMVHHISGVRDYLVLQALRGIGDDEYYTAQDALEVISRQKALNFLEGSEYLYSNSGFFLLSEIVKRVSGKTLAEFARENIFEPLGMNNTHFHDDCTVIVPNRATGYAPTEDGLVINETILDIVGDGGVFTTVEDMYLWDQNFYDNKLDNGLIDLILTKGKLNSGEEISYAFGLVHGDYKGLKTVGHGGAFVGFRTAVLRFPDERFSVVCLSNLATMDPGRLCQQVAEIFLADRFVESIPSEQMPTTTGAERIAMDADTLQAFEGQYKIDTNTGFWEIEAIEGGLKLIRDEYQVEMFPYSENEFRGEIFGSLLLIKFDKEGGELGFEFYVDGAKRGDYKRYVPPVYTAAQLAEYTGDYYSDELDMIYTIEAENGKLYARFRNAPDAPAKAVEADVFRMGFIGTSFFRDDAGALKGFEISAGRVKGIRFIKK
ncbi:MAG TPA: serine hydrolase domain-containing protein [Acidobacteriota bacterium]|nr:serine hydrolase domain-containing protein [Acidobacteriota bacterium]